MATKRQTGAKRYREFARRERQEEKARRKAARRAAKDDPSESPPDGALETEADETAGVVVDEPQATEQEAVTAQSHAPEGKEPTGPDRDSARQTTAVGDGGQPLAVTPEAFELLLTLLADDNITDDGDAVRFSLADDGSLSLSIDVGRPEDETFAHDGRTVLVMEPEVARRLENDTLDVEESSDGPGLVLRSQSGETTDEAEA